MLYPHRPQPCLLSPFGCCSACSYPKDKNIQRGVAYEPIPAMHPPFPLPGGEQTRHSSCPIDIDLDPAILIMQRGVDKHRLLGDINIVATELPNHSWQFPRNASLTANHIDHRRIKPNPKLSCWSSHSFLTLMTFTHPPSRHPLSRLQRHDELLPLHVH